MTPFTIDEATEICEDFEDLKDTEFTIGSFDIIYLVQDVVISPFPEQDKQAFIERYIATKDSVQSLKAYDGEEYDVLLFAYDADNEADLVHMNIRAFANEHGIGYSFPVHS